VATCVAGVRPPWWRDAHFLLALAAGPAFWASLAVWAPPRFEPDWPLRAPLVFLMPVLVYPVLEEIVFRAGLQAWLLRRSWGSRARFGVSAANLVASLAFSALHFLQHAPIWAAAVLVPSLVFGYFWDRFRSLAPCIALHVFYNAGYYWLFHS